MASYSPGYEDERFLHPVGQSFHCGICYNVVKDPTMCRHNEHLFCRACITRSLVNSQKCPSCVEPLTVETLTQPSRTVLNLLSELKIRCQFSNRGCEKFIELGNLDRHVKDCGFAPAVCSNEGCRVEVNKQDLLHHETAECELRRVQCHSCNDIRQEMEIVKVNVAAINMKLVEFGEKLDRNGKMVAEKLDETETRAGIIFQKVGENVIAKIELVQEQLHKVKAENLETKECLNEMKLLQELESLITPQTSHQVAATQAQQEKGTAEADEMSREPKILVAGGRDGEFSLNSVQLFSPSDGTWRRLQSMEEARFVPSSFIHDNRIFVCGGHDEGRCPRSMESISMNAVSIDESLTWEIFYGSLPTPLWGHRCVVYNGRLIVIGGRTGCECSHSVTEISLVRPYTDKLLATMPQRRWLHCALLFGSKIVIFGGREDWPSATTLSSVLMYDIDRKMFEKAAPLPYPVSGMAAVKWGDDNAIIAGGVDSDEGPLNKVCIYNINTQKSHMLPDMRFKRKGCVAALVKDTVIVMGGRDENEISLKSVESFKFDRFTWEELPEMPEGKYGATAVVC